MIKVLSKENQYFYSNGETSDDNQTQAQTVRDKEYLTMASILCKPIGACFQFVCAAPCKICSAGCELCSDGISGFCRNPLASFVLITFLTQVPLAVTAALELGGLFNGCKGSIWLTGMLVVAILHMVTCVYLGNRITNRTDEALRDRHTLWQRTLYLMCRDPWIAIYILVLCFFTGWLIIGSTWSINDSMYNSSSSCGSDLEDRVNIVLGLGWFYFFIGPAIFSCNLCCVCCDKTDYAGDDAEFAAKEAEKEAKKQRKNSSARKNSAAGSNTGPDIEAPNASQFQSETMQEPKSKKAPPLRTYSVDGTPVPDDGNADVVEAEVVTDAYTLPPPIRPPEDNFGAQAAKAQAAAEKAMKSVNSKVGGWLSKKENDGNGSNQPDTKATIY